MSINAKPKNLIYKNLNITQIIHAPNKNLYKDRYSLGTSSKPKIPKPVTQRIFIPKSVKNEKLHTKAIRNSSTISSMASTRWNKENFTKYQTKIIKLPRERSRSAKKPTTNLSAKSSPPSSTAGESNEETNHQHCPAIRKDRTSRQELHRQRPCIEPQGQVHSPFIF